MRYTQKMGDAVCAALAEGKLLIEFCDNSDDPKPGLPRAIDVYAWVEQDVEFSAAYTVARTQQATSLAEKALTILSGFAGNAVDVAWARAQSEALRWMAARMDANTYGDKSNKLEPMQLIVKTSLGGKDTDPGVGQSKYTAEIVSLGH